jgi:hypothetical protein
MVGNAVAFFLYSVENTGKVEGTERRTAELQTKRVTADRQKFKNRLPQALVFEGSVPLERGMTITTWECCIPVQYPSITAHGPFVQNSGIQGAVRGMTVRAHGMER